MPRTATYRVQLQPTFGFQQAAGIAGYLDRLGISHIYCSPILQAATGSTHGYDVVDHARMNEELGGTAGYEAMTTALRGSGLGQLLDIVPNHMAIDGPANRWWWDVLENGPASLYAAHFDIDWSGGPEKSDHTVLMPVLGDHYGRILDNGEISVSYTDGAFRAHYHEHEFPLSLASMTSLLARVAKKAKSSELADLAARAGDIPAARTGDVAGARHRHLHKEALRSNLAHLLTDDERLAEILEAVLNELSKDPDELDALLRRQHYRLAYWRTAREEIDYRRFFNIDTLVGVRVEADDVFADTHELILSLVRSQTIEGLRVDHVDGLRDPEGYLHRLRRAAGSSTTLLVEKILGADEALPETWPVEGTSGYDFANRAGSLFVDPRAAGALSATYERFCGDDTPYDDIVLAAKRQVMSNELAAEVERLTGYLATVCDGYRRHRDHTRSELRDAVTELMAAFPVYRTYAQPNRPVTDVDRGHVANAVLAATQGRPDIDMELLGFVGELLVLDWPGAPEAEFALRFAQVSAAVMAKGAEDTAFYRYNRLISLNEVGGDPGRIGGPVADFHAWCEGIATRWPHTMLALSTHDTKRSADVRARLAVLSEIPDAWSRAVDEWAAHNDSQWAGYGADRNLEYLVYQTLVGAWPISIDRLNCFVEKAIREAKLHTSWDTPDEGYEQAVGRFVDGILNDGEFVRRLEQFLETHGIVAMGRINSLAQTTLLLTCPGVPDIYQGDELWDLRLVDPDNRSPIEYGSRSALLADLDAGGLSEAVSRDDEGAPKLWLLSRILRDRRDRPSAYGDQSFSPILASGRKAAHIVAFAREQLIVAVPRLPVGLGGDWQDTVLPVPAGNWRNLLTGKVHGGGDLSVADLLGEFPVAVLGPVP